MKTPERLDYKRLKYIIDHTRDSPLVEAQRIYGQAIRLYKERGYHLYTNENKTNEVKAFLSESLDLELEESLSKVDDGSPEGLGMDEIDWESYDHE